MSIFITFCGFGLFLTQFLRHHFPDVNKDNAHTAPPKGCVMFSVLLITHTLSTPAGLSIAEKQKDLNNLPGLCQQSKNPGISTFQQSSTQEYC